MWPGRCSRSSRERAKMKGHLASANRLVPFATGCNSTSCRWNSGRAVIEASPAPGNSFAPQAQPNRALQDVPDNPILDRGYQRKQHGIACSKQLHQSCFLRAAKSLGVGVPDGDDVRRCLLSDRYLQAGSSKRRTAWFHGRPRTGVGSQHDEQEVRLLDPGHVGLEVSKLATARSFRGKWPGIRDWRPLPAKSAPSSEEELPGRM